MSKLVTIFGGSGFVGRYVARRMAKEGWRVRVATRDPNEALFVKPYGAVGQVEPVFCNIRDEASVRSALAGAEAVVNCVAVLAEKGKNSFQALHVEGAARVARLATEAGVVRLVHISAIGADVESKSGYSRSKGQGEAAVLAEFPRAMILRPSILFGTEDEFFNRFATMTRFGPVLPIVGGKTRFQPAYVDDVARAVVAGVLGTSGPGVYELGGPDTQIMRGLIDRMLVIVQRRRLVVNVPFAVARPLARVMGWVQTLSLGIVPAQFTRDQLIDLAKDNVVSEGARGFRQLGIEPVSMETILPEYLWRFRPSGQFAAIKASAKNLRKA